MYLCLHLFLYSMLYLINFSILAYAKQLDTLLARKIQALTQLRGKNSCVIFHKYKYLNI